MNKLLILLALLGSAGCSLMVPQRRADRYMECVKELYREGISEQRLKFLCDSIIDHNNSI